MIAWLNGIVLTRQDEQLVVDVNGVGYLVSVPVGVAADLAPGQPVELHVSTQMRENALALFGFDSATQLECFQVLLGVSGVGPKLALNVLSSLTSPGVP